MTDLQAAIGITQLQRLEEMLAFRREVIKSYREALAEALSFPEIPGTAPWLFTGLLPEDKSVSEIAQRLLERGIETRPVFVPMHRLPMYQEPDGEFPVSCYVADHGISLPTHSTLVKRDVQFIVSNLLRALR